MTKAERVVSGDNPKFYGIEGALCSSKEILGRVINPPGVLD